MNEVINKYISKLRSPKLLIIAGVIGIALIFLSTLGGESDTKTTSSDEITVEEYRTQLQQDIAKIVESITGSDNVTVVITLESGIRYEYADTTEGTSSDKTEKDTQTTSSELKQGYITVKTSDGGEQALLVTTEMPQVRGVAIVCEGGDNLETAEKIQNTVTAALNITSKRVYIAGGSSNEKR